MFFDMLLVTTEVCVFQRFHVRPSDDLSIDNRPEVESLWRQRWRNKPGRRLPRDMTLRHRHLACCLACAAACRPNCCVPPADWRRVINRRPSPPPTLPPGAVLTPPSSSKPLQIGSGYGNRPPMTSWVPPTAASVARRRKRSTAQVTLPLPVTPFLVRRVTASAGGGADDWRPSTSWKQWGRGQRQITWPPDVTSRIPRDVVAKCRWPGSCEINSTRTAAASFTVSHFFVVSCLCTLCLWFYCLPIIIVSN